MEPRRIIDKEEHQTKDTEAAITPGELARIFLKRAHRDKDVALGISGYEGEGKSVLACQIVIQVLLENGHSPEYILEHFNEYMIYSPNRDEIYKKITKPEKYAPINSDEATKALYKLNWASASQKFLNVLFQLCRKENKINILCIPRFTDLNEYFRNHRIMFWLHILETGTAVLMIRDWSPFNKDPWHIDENKKLIEMSRKGKRIIDYDTDEKLNSMKKTRNFVAIVKWDDLESRFKKVYREGKEAFGYDDLNESLSASNSIGARNSDMSDLKRKTAVLLLAQKMDPKEIAKHLEVNPRAIARYVREHEATQLAEQSLDVSKPISNTKYQNEVNSS